ncbi:MAG TPA: hypothetical protein ENG95_05590 [Nitrospirae bacterium]|nr:hypothetical protein [Nitrospirota bacterium]HDO26094.1 hypothetical protein [Nitrospirota bacterium]
MGDKKTAVGALFKAGELVSVINAQFEWPVIGRVATNWSGGGILLKDVCVIFTSKSKQGDVKSKFAKTGGKVVVTGKDLMIKEVTEKDTLYQGYKQALTGVVVCSENDLRGLDRIKTN